MSATATRAAAQPKPESVRRVALASMIGTSIEWYDFFIFGTASALVFGRLFFPTFSELAGTLAAFASFAVGFVARPVGGLVFGHFGDRFGRKTALIVTLTMMGLATFAMGLMPTYDTIGVWAPILMVALRFLQGLAVGGEWGGAVLMATEHAGNRRKGFFGSFAQVGSAVGGLMSTGMFLLMQQLPEDDFIAWGWRVPFLLSIALVFVGLFIRLKIMESPEFEQVKAARRVAKMPVIELLRTDPRNVLLAAGLYCAHGVLFYAMTVYTLNYDDQLWPHAEHVSDRRDGRRRGTALHDPLARRAIGPTRPPSRNDLRHAVHHGLRTAPELHDHVAGTRAHVACRDHQHLRGPQRGLLAYRGAVLGDVPGARALQRRVVGLSARRSDRRVRAARCGFARRRGGRRLLADCGDHCVEWARRVRVHFARAAGCARARSAGAGVAGRCLGKHNALQPHSPHPATGCRSGLPSISVS
jgi:hypothetical protein